MALPCQECYEHIVCLQMFWLGRDNCFTKDLYRLLHVQKLHNLSRSPLVPFIFVIISKKRPRCGLLSVDAWVFRCRCSIPGVRREERGWGEAPHISSPPSPGRQGKGRLAVTLGDGRCSSPCPLGPVSATSARWYLWPQQPSESLILVVEVATGGVWGGRWCL